MINTIIQGDCKTLFPEISKKHKIDLVLTDPPYNINFKGYDVYKDNLPDNEYIALLSMLKDYPVCLIHYPEETTKYVVPALGTNVTKKIVWCYDSNSFTPNHNPRLFRDISIYNKIPDFTRIKRPYKWVNDKRTRRRIENGSQGRKLADWWDDITLIRNVHKEKTAHPCQIPVNLFIRLLLLLTNEGDLIVDPFIGSGSVALACLWTNRSYIGIELSEKYVEISNKRIEAWKSKHIDIFGGAESL